MIITFLLYDDEWDVILLTILQLVMWSIDCSVCNGAYTHVSSHTHLWTTSCRLYWLKATRLAWQTEYIDLTSSRSWESCFICFLKCGLFGVQIPTGIFMADAACVLYKCNTFNDERYIKSTKEFQFSKKCALQVFQFEMIELYQYLGGKYFALFLLFI